MPIRSRLAAGIAASVIAVGLTACAGQPAAPPVTTSVGPA